jgi:biopolymer transport protein ExbD
MSRRHYYKHKIKEEDIDVTPLLNVMVVLVAFLIFSAVFTRISIQELVLPAQGDSKTSQDTPPPVIIEVIVRKQALEMSDGKNILDRIPKLGNKYDTQKLSEYLLHLKEKHKDKQDVTVLLEPEIDYESMIQVMDAVKIAEIRKEGQDKLQRVLLFPQVSIGDAP